MPRANRTRAALQLPRAAGEGDANDATEHAHAADGSLARPVREGKGRAKAVFTALAMRKGRANGLFTPLARARARARSRS